MLRIAQESPKRAYFHCIGGLKNLKHIIENNTNNKNKKNAHMMSVCGRASKSTGARERR